MFYATEINTQNKNVQLNKCTGKPNGKQGHYDQNILIYMAKNP